MTVSNTPGMMKKFRRTPWRFQPTFLTPLPGVGEFVSTALSAISGLNESSITINQIVFEPKNLNALLSKHALSVGLRRDHSLMAQGATEAVELLMAALLDWVDFLFVPSPKPFVIFADHDEYTTFCSNTKSGLNLAAHPLLAKGFKHIDNYQREL